MAQTRAIGKAYRNVIGWVIKLAGYEGTPSEEMVKVGESQPIPAPVNNEKITEEEAGKLLMAGLSAGFNRKVQVIAGVNRLLKTNIKELTELNESQAKSVRVALLTKKNQK